MSLIKNLNKKCYAELSVSKPGVIASRAGCDNDLVAVASLPDQWDPQPGGELLATYLNDQKVRFNNLLDEMKNETDNINKEVDARIRRLALFLMDQVKQYGLDIKQIIDKSDPDGEILSSETRNEILKQVNDIHLQHKEEVARFRSEALNIERERSESLRTLMRNFFQRLIAVGFRTPTDLLNDFDHYFFEINQQLLSNTRCYIDMEVQLYSQAMQCFVHARSLLNQMAIKSNVTQPRRSRSAFPPTNESKISRLRSTSASYLYSSINRLSTDSSLGGLIMTVKEFDECVSRMLEIYRGAIVKVFTGFYNKLNTLCEDLSGPYSMDSGLGNLELIDLQLMIERAASNLSTNLAQKSVSYNDLLRRAYADGVDLQRSLHGLGDRLRETYFILNEAAHLWDAHILRSAVAQKLTMAAIEDLVTSNDALELGTEIALNIAIEQLRQGSEVDKLQLQYDILMTQLGAIESMYLIHRDAELQKLEEYLRFLPTLTSAVLAEIDLFLQKYPRAVSETKFSGSDSTTPHTVAPGLNTQIARTLLQTELQMCALLYWKNGFLESVESNKQLIPDELNSQARQWIDGRAGTLHMRYTMKSVSHCVRAERLRMAYELRKAEMNYHEQRLVDHTRAISNLMVELDKEVSTCLNLESPQLYPLLYWSDELDKRINELISEENVDPEVKKQKMTSYGMRLMKYRRCFEESLGPALEEIQLNVLQRVQETRIANVRFLSEIHLFSEGGQYSAKEAERATAALLRSADAIEAFRANNNLLNTLAQRRTELLAFSDLQLEPLQRIIDECVPKRGGRGGDKPKKK